jgi:TonB family protein
MKIIILLLSFVICSSLNARELTVRVIEGWKSTPLANTIVILKKKSGKEVQEGMTDSEGVVIFSKLKNGEYIVEAVSPNENYTNRSVYMDTRFNNSAFIILRYTVEFENEQLTIEDSIYGVVKKPDTDKNHIDSLGIAATFPGGHSEMVTFLQTNIIYPEISRELGDQGRIYVEFVVEPDGVITHVIARNSVTYELDYEAKRLVRAMPNWESAVVKGEKVRAYCTLPITFSLN